MYKAVFIDLDGTLLRNDHSISEATRDTIQQLIKKNILVVLVSARPLHGITPISEWLGIQSSPLASLNGAYISMDDKMIYQSCHDLQTNVEVHQRTKALDVTLIYYNGLKWYAEISNAAIAKEQRITDVNITIAPFKSLMQEWEQNKSCSNKMMAIGNEITINELENKLLSIYKDNLNIYTSKPTYLEIMRKDASKTNALVILLKKFNISREQAIAIGDNYNDRDMIIYAGKGIAMGNAPEPIKSIADYVTETNENDGVRKAIELFL